MKQVFLSIQDLSGDQSQRLAEVLSLPDAELVRYDLVLSASATPLVIPLGLLDSVVFLYVSCSLEIGLSLNGETALTGTTFLVDGAEVTSISVTAEAGGNLKVVLMGVTNE